MKKLFGLMLVLIAFAANSQERKINKGETWYRIYNNKDLEMKTDERFVFSTLIIDGKNLVFEYYMRADDYDDIADDEYMERVVFEVPAKATSFYYHDSTLRAAFYRGCFCPDRGWHALGDGFIKGKKINATTWQVEIDAMTKATPNRTSGPVTKKFKATFVLQTNPAKKKK
ncbi:MAG: hypothetical protein ACHQHP_06625 [Bacteroidia bacterium]